MKSPRRTTRERIRESKQTEIEGLQRKQEQLVNEKNLPDCVLVVKLRTETLEHQVDTRARGRENLKIKQAKNYATAGLLERAHAQVWRPAEHVWRKPNEFTSVSSASPRGIRTRTAQLNRWRMSVEPLSWVGEDISSEKSEDVLRGEREWLCNMYNTFGIRIHGILNLMLEFRIEIFPFDLPCLFRHQ